MTLTAAPILGLGAKLYIATAQGTPPTIAVGAVTGGTLIGKLTKITPAKPKFATEDITTLDSPGTTRTFMKTLIEPGEWTLEGQYESGDAGQALLAAAFNSAPIAAAGQAFPFLHVLPIDFMGGQLVIGDQDAFNALVTDYAKDDDEVAKTITFKATLKVTGPTVTTLGT
jgi:hypothetical protein